MAFRFICVETEVGYELYGTDSEERAREWAIDNIAYDTVTGLSLNANGVGGDLELPDLATFEAEEE